MRDVYIFLIVFLVIVLTIILQANLFDALRLVGTTPNLGIVLIAAIGLMTGKERGATIGAVYGGMIDILEGRNVGGYLAAFLLLGYFCGRIGKNFSKENKTTTIAFVGLGTLALEGTILLFQFFSFGQEIITITVGIEMIKEALYNMLLAIISFRFLYGVSDLINRTKKNYYLL